MKYRAFLKSMDEAYGRGRNPLDQYHREKEWEDHGDDRHSPRGGSDERHDLDDKIIKKYGGYGAYSKVLAARKAKKETQ